MSSINHFLARAAVTKRKIPEKHSLAGIFRSGSLTTVNPMTA
jgi:hypothetical protein